MLPNFLFIGPDKSGSSWLYDVLSGHRQCFLPKAKDIYFFDRYYGKGLDWYASFFANAPDNTKVLGEICHDYLYSTAAADRIRQDLPGVKLLVCLRNPVDRTFSHYLYLLRNGVTTLPFEAALQEYAQLVDNSLYFKHLSEYWARFPREQVKVTYYDRLVRDPKTFASEIFEYLGLPSDDKIDFSRVTLPASRPRSVLLAKAAKLGANMARAAAAPGVVGTVKRSFIKNWLYVPYSATEKPVPNPSTRKELFDVFESDLARLEKALRSEEIRAWLKA